MINPLSALARILLAFVVFLFALALFSLAQLGLRGSTGPYASAYPVWATVSIMAILAMMLLPIYICCIDPLLGYLRRRRRLM